MAKTSQSNGDFFAKNDDFSRNFCHSWQKLKEEASLFPQKSGVYRMYDENKKICYIGKAKNLRHRVLSYFNFSGKREITHILLSKVVFIDYLVTQTEEEALILENNLIKRHQPFFNINLKDNKTYPYFLLGLKGGFPYLIKTRSMKQNNFRGIFFGPYTNVVLMDAYLNAIHQIYPLKKCKQQKFPKNFKPCLYFHIGECLDYCTGSVDKETIKKMFEEIKQLLRGNQNAIVAKLKEKMIQQSAQQNFEKAMHFRDAIDIFTRLNSRQFVSTISENDFDVFNHTFSDHFLIVALLQFRDGKLANKHIFELATPLFSDENQTESGISNGFLIEIFSRLFYDYYSHQQEKIAEVLVPSSLLLYKGAEEELKNALVSAAKKRNRETKETIKEIYCPHLMTPQKGAKKHFLKLAQVNAALSLQELIRKNQRFDVLKMVKNRLSLTRTPKIVECFDVANTADQCIMAGMTRFVDGQKDRANYRLFNMTMTAKQDDFLSMKEAVVRRYHRLLSEKKVLPDLIVIDGGKGQLSVVKSAIKSLKSKSLDRVCVISLAKKEEWIFFADHREPLKLSHTDEVLRFLVKIRDETHRFVNSSHVRRRDKSQMDSRLRKIKGFGEKKIKILLMHFDRWQDIENCSLEQIIKLPFFGKKDYLALKDFFEREKKLASKFISLDQ